MYKIKIMSLNYETLNFNLEEKLKINCKKCGIIEIYNCKLVKNNSVFKMKLVCGICNTNNLKIYKKI